MCNDFTGCTRGANSTTAAAISNGTTVTQFDGGGVPRNIVRTPDNNYLLYPYPDKQYTLIFDYFTFPSDLSASKINLQVFLFKIHTIFSLLFKSAESPLPSEFTACKTNGEA